jgi:hypothetical protein|tara:strand:+ start:440 stop:709 length:270 start_codon:yes stop_codon:yes gene_type:complete
MENVNAKAKAGLILGLVATLFNFIPFLGFVSVITGTLAIIFGAIGLGKVKMEGGKSHAKAAIVLGIVNLAWYFISVIILVVGVGAAIAQ